MIHEILERANYLEEEIDNMQRNIELVHEAVATHSTSPTVQLGEYGDFYVDKETFQQIAEILLGYYTEIKAQHEIEFEEL